MDWRVCVGFPDYEISEAGDVRRLTDGGRRYKAGYHLSPKPHARGYLCFTLVAPGGRSKTVLAHRLVALTFIGAQPSDVHEVAHGDGTRTNNHWRNLRWALPVENQHDRKFHGTWQENEACGSTKVSNDAVADIRARYAAGGERYRGGAITMQALADEHGLSIAQVSRIVNGKHRPDRCASS